MHTGDEAFGRRMLDVVLRMIEHWERHRTREGLIADLHTLFLDWGSHLYSYGAGSRGPTGALTAMNAYYLGTLKSATAMAGFLGRNTTARELGEIYEEVRRSMRRDLFDPGVGLFRDGAGHPGPEANYSQTANALAVLYGAATEGRERTILTKAFDPPPELEIIPANAHFVRQAGEALFETGCDELAVRWLRAGFGPMLAKGPGTLWETFHIHASLCQATGAGVAYLMARYLAGLYPAEPGYRVIGLDPHPAGPDSLRARLTTPFGPVNVAWERHGDDLDCRLDLPEALQTRPIRAGSKVRLKSEK